jgi:apolipoprotein N-acyltransferase
MERLASTVMLLSGTRRALVAFLAGLIGVLALPPFGFFAAFFVSFTLLVWLLDGASASHRPSVSAGSSASAISSVGSGGSAMHCS